MAGHEGPSSAEADELQLQGDKVIQFACALGFDEVNEAPDSEEHITTSAAPAAPTRRKRKLEAPERSHKSGWRLGFEEDDEEEQEKGKKDPESLDEGQFEEGSACLPLVAKKLREEAGRPAVSIVRMLRATSKVEGGLPVYLRRAGGLRSLDTIIKRLGGELTINLEQGDDDPEVLEITLGQCNNVSGNFHEPLSELKTAKVDRAAHAAVKISDSGEDVARWNINAGGCTRRFDGKGGHHCRLLHEYPEGRVKAMRQTAAVVYEMVSESFPGARVLLVQTFGNFQERKHRRDDKPVVEKETTTATGMEVWSTTTKHLSLAPGDVDALRSIVEGRLALKAAAETVLGRLPAAYTEADVKKGALDMLEILVTGEEESPQIREGWDVEKTERLVTLLDGLREKESLEEVLSGAVEVGKAYGPRGYTDDDRRRGGKEGGPKSNFGKTKGDTVAGAMAREAGAKAAVDAADTEKAAAAAKKQLDRATKKRKLTEVARGDQAKGGATLGTGANQVGGAPSNGAAASARRAIPGAPNPARAHGFCFGFGADGVVIAEKLKQLFAGEDGYGDGPITEGGCSTPNFSEAGVTKGKGSWYQDGEECLILSEHNTAKSTEEHPACKIGGTVPVEKVNGSWRLCKWALPFVTTGKIVTKVTHNHRHNGAVQRYHNKKRTRNCVPTV